MIRHATLWLSADAAIAGAPTIAYCKKCALLREGQGTEYILGEVWLLHYY